MEAKDEVSNNDGSGKGTSEMSKKLNTFHCNPSVNGAPVMSTYSDRRQSHCMSR